MAHGLEAYCADVQQPVIDSMKKANPWSLALIASISLWLGAAPAWGAAAPALSEVRVFTKGHEFSIATPLEAVVKPFNSVIQIYRDDRVYDDCVAERSLRQLLREQATAPTLYIASHSAGCAVVPVSCY